MKIECYLLNNETYHHNATLQLIKKERGSQLPQLLIQFRSLFPEVHIEHKPNDRIEHDEYAEHADKSFHREWNPSNDEGDDEIQHCHT